jgi:hypothetical protein
MEKASVYQPFGASSHTESSWPDALSEAHRGYVLAYIEQVQAREAAVIEGFLAARER